MNRHIEIVEVAPRDGLQNEAVALPTAAKVELIRRAAAAGARRIETVSFVSPRTVPQMADAEAVMASLRAGDGGDLSDVRLIGLALNRRGWERALRAEVDEVNFVVVASETFNRRNQGAAISQTLAEIEACAAARAASDPPFAVTIAASFGCPFEGEISPEKVVALARAAAAVGALEIALADTVGVADPLAVERLIAALREAIPGLPIRCHFHNTRNTGLANAYAAWRSGAATLDASLGGIGGCPFAPAATGNIPTEDTAYMFERMGVSTGLSLPRLIEAAAWLERRLGKPLPAMLGRAGPFPSALATA